MPVYSGIYGIAIRGDVYMNEILIVFASATTAVRAKKLLLSKGCKAKTMQTPKEYSVNGCSYSIVTSEECEKMAREIADDLDVKIKGVYNRRQE